MMSVFRVIPLVKLVQTDRKPIVLHVTQLEYHNISIHKIINVPHNVILMNIRTVTNAILAMLHVEHVVEDLVIIV